MTTATADLRAQIRASMGDASASMIEINELGETVFLTGDWSAAVDGEVDGLDAVEQLLVISGLASPVADAMDTAFAGADGGSFVVDVADGSRQWLHVAPIPDPVTGTANVLLSLSVHQRTAVGVAVPAAASPPLPAPQASAPIAPEVHANPTPAPPQPTPVAAAVAPTDPQLVAPMATALAAPAAAAGALTVEAPPDEVAAVETSSTEGESGDADGSVLQRFDGWLDRRGLTRGQVLAAAGVVLFGLFLRVWDLTDLPAGLHGDEAIFGQESQRVLRDGSIGTYSPTALGQPTGPFYIGALFVALLGPTAFAVRFCAAFAGALTIAATYLVAQKRFGHQAALAAAIALSTLTWHIHFSRIAFPLAWWPLALLAGMVAIERATQTGDRRWWGWAGAICAFGVYIYNSHWTWGIGIVLFVIIWMLWPHDRPVNRNPLTLVFGPIGAFVVLIPILNFARVPENGFLNHFNQISRRSGPEWLEAGTGDKIDLLIGWYGHSWKALVTSGTADGVDASGIITQVPLIFAVLAVIGVIEILRRHRTAFTGLMLLTMLALPISPALTINGFTRRDFAMTPLVAIAVGIGAMAVLGFGRRVLGKPSVPWVAAGLVAVALFTGVVPYFTTFRDEPFQQWVFVDELGVSSDIVLDVAEDGPVFVNWYSARHYYRYETLQYLLADVPGADRAPLDQGFNEQPPLGLEPDVAGSQLFMLVGDYANQLEALQAMHPDGKLIANEPSPRVAAYLVPAN